MTSTEDRAITITRTIGAPRDLVFTAFTDIEHLSRWWGPDGFTTTTASFEFREDGVWEFVMHGPDGTDYPNWIRWLEIVPPDRIRLLHGEAADDPASFESTFTFTERDGATEIVLHNVFPTREQRDRVVEVFHAVEGGEQTLGRLAEYVVAIGTSR